MTGPRVEAPGEYEVRALIGWERTHRVTSAYRASALDSVNGRLDAAALRKLRGVFTVPVLVTHEQIVSESRGGPSVLPSLLLLAEGAPLLRRPARV